MQILVVSKIIFAVTYSYCAYRFVIMPNVFLIKRHYKFKKQGVRTLGTIVKSSASATSTEDTEYLILVQYIVDGRNYYLEKTVHISRLPPLGAKVEVYYDEHYPANAVITIPSSNGAPYFIIFFILLVTGFIIVALFSAPLPESTVSGYPE
jgi:hypothetical protein